MAHPIAAAVRAFLRTLAVEPPIKPGAPDPYVPPAPGALRPEEHLQVGVITQFVSTLVRAHDDLSPPESGIERQTG